ncbi:MAG: universal stress protein [Gammaproteobacteria bacterium]|nr:universal stress protein [Gammaproteobacteria bacterium]
MTKKTPENKAKKIPKGAILVPVDFYPHSGEAIKFAAYMAELMGTPLVVLHVVHDPVDVPGFYVHEEKRERRLQRMEDVAREMLDRFMQKMARENPNNLAISSARTKLIVGLPVARILEVIEEIRPKCVVMGSQGRSELSQLFVGSTAEKVVHLCPVPVTIVKSGHIKQ